MAHYQVLERVGTTGGSHLRRGRQVEDSRPVMLKLARAEDASAHAAAFGTSHPELKIAVNLSLDDFGTGYSSLAYLRRFPLHALKTGQSFVRDIGTDWNHTALITVIIAMAHSLQLGVLAEGVETRELARFLLAHGCCSAQGFYDSKAVPAQTFSDLLYKLFASH